MNCFICYSPVQTPSLNQFNQYDALKSRWPLCHTL